MQYWKASETTTNTVVCHTIGQNVAEPITSR